MIPQFSQYQLARSQNQYYHYQQTVCFYSVSYPKRARQDCGKFTVQCVEQKRENQQRGKEYYEGLLKTDIQETNNASGLGMLIPNLKFVLTSVGFIAILFLLFMYSNGLL
eukprot:TRINITY_DN322_c1_g1_i4.p1 TRINITY_DN322_c1_g1~~TRINITY_DN322_c1_g1_i4.p1  ORF type:complete len:110 (+),score=1.85 TRINITY_DN322_c1_g1_i4:147-476(+)